MADEVKLYGAWASPFSKRVEIALKLKGVDYKYYDEDISNKSQCLLTYNPVHKKIPAFVHGERAIAESLVIVEYIDETWPKFPIMPKDPFERARARFWARFIDEKCLYAIWKACRVMEDREIYVENSIKYLSLLENELKDKKFFGGETIGLADIAGNFIAFWLRPIQEIVKLNILSEERFPRLCQWSHELAKLDDVKLCIPPNDKLKAFFSARLGITLSN